MKIILDNVCKSFGTQKIIDNFTLHIEKPSITCIMGASGKGKTTLLRIIAGLESVDSGSVDVEGKLGYVFQEPRLFPWLNVLDNVCCVVNGNALPRAELKKRAAEILSKLGLEKDLSKKPRQLSGGMQQRVSFARAIICNPDILLLDEGFGSQDRDNAYFMYDMCKDFAFKQGKIILAVTHNKDEAELLAGNNLINIQ